MLSCMACESGSSACGSCRRSRAGSRGRTSLRVPLKVFLSSWRIESITSVTLGVLFLHGPWLLLDDEALPLLQSLQLTLGFTCLDAKTHREAGWFHKCE